MKLVSTLNAGQSFGELALLSDKPRMATIKTKTDCYFAMLGKQDFQNIYGVMQMNKLNKKVDFFKSIPIFCELTREQLSPFTYYLKEMELHRNEYLYNEGDKCEYCYIIINGEFEMTMNKEIFDAKESKNKEILSKSNNNFASNRPFSYFYNIGDSQAESVKDKYLDEMVNIMSK